MGCGASDGVPLAVHSGPRELKFGEPEVKPVQNFLSRPDPVSRPKLDHGAADSPRETHEFQSTSAFSLGVPR
eukprot:2162352-Alexandrium_andersonii.AAC.1